MKYDYLVVGAGLYGSVFAHEEMCIRDRNQAVAYLTKDADGLLWEYISSNGSGYQKTGILNYTNQIKGMDISMYSDAKIVKKKIKVNRINTVQISAQVKGSDVVKFLDQMGMSKEINAAAAVDYNTLPAIDVYKRQL